LNNEEAKEEVLYSAFKHYSVAHEYKLAAILLRSAGGTMSLNQALDYVRSDAFISLDDEGHKTTMKVKLEEDEMRKTVRNEWDTCQKVKWDIIDENIVLALDQLRAIRFILNSKDRYMNVSGIAGAGKTTLLKETIRKLDQAGIESLMLAPTSASEKKLKEDFPNAGTLQAYEKSGWVLKEATFIFLDEVSMVSVPQMSRLVKLVKDHNLRLVTLGDSAQHVAPERGDAIRILEESKSIRSVELTETYRAKKKHLKEAVLDLKAGGKRRERAFNRLDVHGDIVELEDSFSLRDRAINTHLEALRDGKISVLACPVHAEAREAAEIVRFALRADGKLGEDQMITRLQRVGKDEGELKDKLHYQLGRIVIFRSKTQGGFRPGQKWTVVGHRNDGRVLLESGEGSGRGLLDITGKGQWAIYDTEIIRLADGDQIRITEGCKSKHGDKFKNNDIAKIKEITRAGIALEDGRILDRDMVHIDQGYCVTSYATQCRTVFQMVALAPVLAFSTMSAKMFYVLVSRATHKVAIYTDSKEGLKEAVLRPGERMSVYDFDLTPAPPEPARDYREEVEKTI
jgi:ATP-dependent exoDNAse (exonuclease V) alpha subunit